MSNIYVGMDVHQQSLTVAVLPTRAAAPTRVDRLPNDLATLRRYLERAAAAGPLQVCYEASGAGFALQRTVTGWGHACTVIAPSLIPTKPGVKRKHDRYDATQLVRLFRAGELTAVRVPSVAEEQVRDLVRCRETLQRELLQSKHYLLKFLARRGLVYRDGQNWAPAHLTWLEALANPGSPLSGDDLIVLREYLALYHYKNDRRLVLDRAIAERAELPTLAPAVGRLRCFRGIQTHTAMVLATEIGDWRRCATAGQLMAYLGLVPSEHSSGTRQRLGAITKAGNSHCRHVLLQAAWSYRHRPKVAAAMRARQRAQPPAVVGHAWKAQHRLHTLFQHLAFRKQSRIAVVAVARELAGFLWAVMRELEPVVVPAVPESAGRRRVSRARSAENPREAVMRYRRSPA
jgi:transposase